MNGSYRGRLAIVATMICVAGVFGSRLAGQSGTSPIEAISVTPAGVPGGGQIFVDSLYYDIGAQKISADDRYVVFASGSNQLVANDTNGRQDIFVRDRQTGTTTMVSRAADGSLGNDHAGQAAISADGRFVAFVSAATNLVPGDTNGFPDVFVRDLQTGTLVRASVSSGGGQANAGAFSPSISADGRYVAFASGSDNLVPGDTNVFNVDVFVRDMVLGTTERVSLRPDGSQIVGADSTVPSISADGRRVAFAVFNDTNGGPTPGIQPNLHHGIYVRDLNTNQTILVSARPDGTPSELLASRDPVISANGRYVSFTDWEDLDPTAPDSDQENDGPFSDVFLRDLQTSTTTRISLPFPGGPAEESGGLGTVSADGRYVAYSGSNDGQIRIRDRSTGTTMVITAPGGVPADGNFGPAAISSDGAYVYFESLASNLVPNDTNGVVDSFLFQTAPRADLSLTLQASTLQPAVNSDVTFTIKVANGGPSEAASIAVSAPLPAGLTYVSDSGGGAYANATGIWTVGTLAAGSTSTLTIVGHFTATAAVTMTAEVSASSIGDPDSTPDNHNPAEDDQQSVVLQPDLADLSLDLQANTATPAVSSNVLLTARVANAGPGKATGVAARLTLPAGLTFVSASPAGGYDAASGVWSIGTLLNGANTTLTIIARVATAAPIDVSAQVIASNQADPDSTPNNDNPAEDDQHAVHLAPVVTGIIVNDATAVVNGSDGKCTLIEAIIAADTDLPSGNAVGECVGGNGADVITLGAVGAPKDPTGVRDQYRLNAVHNATLGANGLPAITSDITIEGRGAEITRTGGPSFRLFVIVQPGRLTLNNVTISGGMADAFTPSDGVNGGGILNSGGVLTLTNSSVIGNQATCAGGGILSYAPLAIRGSVLRSNVSTSCSGGAIETFYASSLIIDTTTIQSNRAPTGSGGGLMIHGTTTAAITNSAIDSNTAKIEGGGLLAHNADANVTMSDTRVTNNIVTAGHGGGISNGRLDAAGNKIVDGGTMTLTNVTVSGNQALGGAGGGILVTSNGSCCPATFTMTGGLIEGNVATGPLAVGGGGGLALFETRAGADAQVNGVVVRNNRAPNANGGGIFTRGHLTMTGGELRGNQAGSSGGGLDNGVSGSLSGGAVNVTNVAIESNTAGSYGGGIFNASTMTGTNTNTVIVSGGTLRSNSAVFGGGAIFNRVNAVVTIKDGARVTGNHADNIGGGINNEGELLVFGSTLSENSATEGGAIHSTGPTFIYFSTISANTASRGAGIRVSGDRLNISGSTLSGNIAGLTGAGALHVTGNGGGGAITSGLVNFLESTIANNVGSPGGIYNEAGGVNFASSILGGNRRPDNTFAECSGALAPSFLSGGNNIVGEDPLCPLSVPSKPQLNRTIPSSMVFSHLLTALGDHGGATATHGLLPGSLAIDALAPVAGACTATDQRGEPRTADGDGDGIAKCDVGAFEQQTPAPVPAAVLTAIGPVVPAGTTKVVTLEGSAFMASAVASWNGSPRETFVRSPTRIEVTLEPGDVALVGEFTTGALTVRNPTTPPSNALLLTFSSGKVSAVQGAIVPPGTTDIATASSNTGIVSATVTNNDPVSPPVTVTVATYSSSPFGGTPFSAGGMFDVRITGADPTDTADVRFYYPSSITGAAETALQMQYWTGTGWAPVLGSGGAPPLKDMTNNLDGTVSGGRFSLRFDNTSTPTITNLSGTVFAIAGVNSGSPRIGVRVRGQGVTAPGSEVRFFDLDVTNSGPGDAQHLLINQIVLRTLGGSGTATLNAQSQTMLPIVIPSLNAGETVPVRIYVNVPSTLTRLSMTLNGSVDAVSPPATLSYSTAATVIISTTP
jgi:uncharacterized repeat protein (TIGR01451 family)